MYHCMIDASLGHCFWLQGLPTQKTSPPGEGALPAFLTPGSPAPSTESGPEEALGAFFQANTRIC